TSNLLSKEDAEKELNDRVAKEIFNYENSISKSCENLTKAPQSKFMGKSFIESFQETLGKDVNDPFLQAFLAPLKKAVRYQKMKEFFVEVSNYKEMHNTAKVGILDKGYFYYKALEAVREIKEHKEDLNVASDRAYRMFSLARAIQLKPELAQDNAVVDFC